MRQGCLDDPEGRIDVGLDDGVEFFRRHFEDGIERLLPARVADEDVEAAEPGDGIGNQLLAEFFIAKIARECHSLAPCPSQ